MGASKTNSYFPFASRITSDDFAGENRRSSRKTRALPISPSYLYKRACRSSTALTKCGFKPGQMAESIAEGQRIHIPERHEITIQVTGAVQQPGPVKILSGTRCWNYLISWKYCLKGILLI